MGWANLSRAPRLLEKHKIEAEVSVTSSKKFRCHIDSTSEWHRKKYVKNLS